MYVCVCRAVTERQLRQLVRDGAEDVSAVNRCTGLGGGCGRCVPYARAVIADERAALHRRAVAGGAAEGVVAAIQGAVPA